MAVIADVIDGDGFGFGLEVGILADLLFFACLLVSLSLWLVRWSTAWSDDEWKDWDGLGAWLEVGILTHFPVLAHSLVSTSL